MIRTITSKTLTKSLKSGESVTGDTKITVAPKAGYAAAKDETYQVNGKAVAKDALNESGSYTFPITENTKVSLKTDRAAFAITTPEMEHGTIIATVDGKLWTTCPRFPAAARLNCRHAQTAAGISRTGS